MSSAQGLSRSKAPGMVLGIKFHKLTYLGRDIGTNYIVAKCDCGKIHRVKSYYYKKIKSCGCAIRDVLLARNTKHGKAKSKEHDSWLNMRRRCFDPKNNRYPHYGARGIAVCERWVDSFENFYSDLGPCPEGFSIERIDRNKDYSPGNCKWADATTQANNKSTNRLVEYNGKKYTTAELARLKDIPYKTFMARLYCGMTASEAAEKPTIKKLSPLSLLHLNKLP